MVNLPGSGYTRLTTQDVEGTDRALGSCLRIITTSIEDRKRCQEPFHQQWYLEKLKQRGVPILCHCEIWWDRKSTSYVESKNSASVASDCLS
jgi:hypothetical protein